MYPQYNNNVIIKKKRKKRNLLPVRLSLLVIPESSSLNLAVGLGATVLNKTLFAEAAVTAKSS
jgi:hypothetical protein